ncbi:SDR family NAD(P)-dependent oxidoreductase [bacterium]|nr:SDR family NAD(P)-dependent oxidoreductase [bacterium]
MALITGASSGIGRAAAKALNLRGWIVYGAARRQERLQELRSLGLKTLTLDVTDPSSVSTCVGSLIESEGQIDLLVNCAGYGSYGAFEDVPLEEGRRQFEVNLFGLAAMSKEVLPFMRQNNSGRIINISSMGGQIYTTMGSWYYASKRAVEGLTDAMRNEVNQYGIKVILIEPGMINSEWSNIAVESMERYSAQGPYAKLSSYMRQILDIGYNPKMAGTPEYIADLIVQAAESKYPKLRYAGPWDAKFLLFWKKYLPDRVFDIIVKLLCCRCL